MWRNSTWVSTDKLCAQLQAVSGHRKPPTGWPSSAVSREHFCCEDALRLAQALSLPQQASRLAGPWDTKKRSKTNKRHPPKLESLARGLDEAPKPHGFELQSPKPTECVLRGGVSASSQVVLISPTSPPRSEPKCLWPGTNLNLTPYHPLPLKPLATFSFKKKQRQHNAPSGSVPVLLPWGPLESLPASTFQSGAGGVPGDSRVPTQLTPEL